MRPILQLALDVDSLDEAIRLAEQTTAWVDWFEVGTGLIVAEGVNAVRVLRQRFPAATLVGDVKIIDGAEGLVSLVLGAGADMVTVSHSAYDATIAAVVRIAHARNRLVVGEYYSLDYGGSAPFRRLAGLGVDYVGLHLPYQPTELRREIIGAMGDVLPKVDLPAIVSGGIDVAVLRQLQGLPLAAVIVGGAILKASDPGEAAREMQQILSEWRLPDLPES
jgi:3-keto-L-gulonate-6-phosphate decarboxylase